MASLWSLNCTRLHQNRTRTRGCASPYSASSLRKLRAAGASSAASSPSWRATRPAAHPGTSSKPPKLLLKLGFEDARETLGSIHKQGRKDAPKSQEAHNPPLPLGEGWGEGNTSDSQQSHINPEQIKLNKKLVRQIRVDTGDGTSMVKFLIDVVEGNEPDARVRDRIEAAKVLLHLCFDNPVAARP